MSVVHVPADSPPEKAYEILQRDGCVVIDGLISADQIDAIRREMAPFVAATQSGVDDFDGLATRRTGSLVGRSQSTHPVILDPTVIGVADRALSHATNYQLHCTQVIDVGPGSKPQPIHRDQWAFDLFPFPKGFDSTFSTMWALTDFTEENGATRVVPGSHQLEDMKQFTYEESVPAEMKAGSVLLYTGSLYHGAGENNSDEHRVGMIVHYSLGWLRQEENQYLSCSQEVLDGLPEEMLRLMGYAKGSYSLGFVDGGRDPIAVVRPDLEKSKQDGSEFDALHESLVRSNG
jgi:hypothetical protein